MAAFFTPNLDKGSLYIEVCDRGSLGDLIKQYNTRRDEWISEAWIWHAFLGLFDGLTYLHTGKYTIASKTFPRAEGREAWVPILHRDIKPDNILLRSKSHDSLSRDSFRSGGANNNNRDEPRKHDFIIVLSDFGLACRGVDERALSGGQLGTMTWWAPELLHDPRPITPLDYLTFPNQTSHTSITDVWALGTCMFNLSASNELSHVVRPPLGMPRDSKEASGWFCGTQSRIRNLVAPAIYTDQLRYAIRMATEWDAANRPDAEMMLGIARMLADEARKVPWKGKKEATLPDWATKRLDLSKKEEFKQSKLY